jgi:hypothetical protein
MNITRSLLEYIKRVKGNYFMLKFISKDKTKKQATLLIFLIYIFIFSTGLPRLGVPLIGYVDEIFSILGVLILSLNIIRTQKLIIKREYLGIIFGVGLFLFIGLLGASVFRYHPLSAVLGQTLLFFKYWGVILTTVVIFDGMDLSIVGERISRHILLITILIFTLLCINLIFNIFPHYQNRYGIGEEYLIFGQPMVLAANGFFLLCVHTATERYMKSQLLKKGVYIMLTIIIVLTLRTKAMVLVGLFYGLYLYIIKWKLKMNVVTILIAGAAMVYLAWDQVYFYFFSVRPEDTARLQLLSKGIAVAKDHFPLGAGFSSFGTYFSISQYSPLYYKYSMSNVRGLRVEDSNYISDQLWGGVLGETGFIGMIIYLLLIVFLFLHIQKVYKYNKYYYLSGISLLAYTTFSTISDSGFLHPTSIPFAMWIAIICLQKTIMRKRKCENDN